MATEKNDLVEIRVPRAVGKEDPNLFISVNGVNYLLPRGKSSKVPRHIAEEFFRSQRAEEALDETVGRMVEMGKEPALQL